MKNQCNFLTIIALTLLNDPVALNLNRYFLILDQATKKEYEEHRIPVADRNLLTSNRKLNLLYRNSFKSCFSMNNTVLSFSVLWLIYLHLVPFKHLRQNLKCQCSMWISTQKLPILGIFASIQLCEEPKKVIHVNIRVYFFVCVCPSLINKIFPPDCFYSLGEGELARGSILLGMHVLGCQKFKIFVAVVLPFINIWLELIGQLNFCLGVNF